MIIALPGPLERLLQVQAHLRCQCRSSPRLGCTSSWTSHRCHGLRAPALPTFSRTCPPSWRCVQEQTKAWLHILLDIAVMICVMLSDPSLPHAPAPLPTLVVTAFLGVMDMVGVGWECASGCFCRLLAASPGADRPPVLGVMDMVSFYF